MKFPARVTLCALLLCFLSLPALSQHFVGFGAGTTTTSASSGATSYRIAAAEMADYIDQQAGEFPLELVLADDHAWTMTLTAHDLRSASFRLTTSDGRVYDRSYLPAVAYRGALVDQPESSVRLTLAGSRIRMYVKDGSGEEYYFETADQPTPDATALATVYRAQPDDLEALCATTHVHQIGDVVPATGTASKSALAPYEAEIAFVVDRLAYEQYTSLEDLDLELLTVLNYTDEYYAEHNITYRLTETFVVIDLESQPWAEKNDAGDMLEEFSAWADLDGSLQHHDVVTLWTGISFGSTIGIAWINAIGSRYRQNVVNFQDGRERRNSNIHAHELGHNWGSGHVSSSGWIMSPSLSSADEIKEWNATTIAAFPGYIETAIEHLDDLEDESTILPVDLGEISVTEEMNDTGFLDPGETANLTLVIENASDAPIENAQISMFNDNNRAKNHVTINSDPVKIAVIEPHATVEVAFNVSLSTSAPVDRSLRFLYLITDEIRSAEITSTIQSGSEPVDELPVELTAFTAVVSEAGIALEWRTATETNNAGFQVEQQTNGGAFEAIAFIEGAGTTLAEQQYRYVAPTLDAGRYAFRLKQIDFDGAFDYSEMISVELLPDAFSLRQNFPNPFNPQTRIEFQIPTSRHVTLEVFDAIGRRVALLVDGVREAGLHSVVFEGTGLPNGTYVYRIKAGAFEETKTMLLLK